MEKSALQIARAAYQPKLPTALQGAVKVKEGEPTQSVDNQEEIKKLFPNTYGMPLVEFVPGDVANDKKMNVGIILSGGQAPEAMLLGLLTRTVLLRHRLLDAAAPHQLAVLFLLHHDSLKPKA